MKRRRSLGSPPDVHARRGTDELNRARESLALAKKNLAAGRCAWAFNGLTSASYALGQARAENEGANLSWAAPGKAFDAVMDDTARTTAKFRKQCITRRVPKRRFK